MSNGSIIIQDTGEGRFIDTRRSNIKSDLIEITEDKLENILLKHLDAVVSKQKWTLPFTVLLSVSVTLVTTDFKAALGITKDVWAAAFIIVFVGSLVLLVRELIRLWKNRDMGTLELLIQTIKNADDESG